MSFNWTCPHCDRAQSVVRERLDVLRHRFDTGETFDRYMGIEASTVRCANEDCDKITVDVWIGPFTYVSGNPFPRQGHKPLLQRTLIPPSGARVVPDYVPVAIRNDYDEACLIRELSPKASATLSRRCLQGMIRDFAKVKPGKLFNEISELESAVADGTAPRGVSEDSIAALTAVRKIGNIGAHMEADVNVIVDVDANEAKILTDLIESLIDDWYVQRHKRQKRFADAIALGAEKERQLKDAKSGQKALPNLSAGSVVEE